MERTLYCTCIIPQQTVQRVSVLRTPLHPEINSEPRGCQDQGVLFGYYNLTPAGSRADHQNWSKLRDAWWFSSKFRIVNLVELVQILPSRVSNNLTVTLFPKIPVAEGAPRLLPVNEVHRTLRHLVCHSGPQHSAEECMWFVKNSLLSPHEIYLCANILYTIKSIKTFIFIAALKLSSSSHSNTN